MTRGHFVVDEPALREFHGITPASKIDELKRRQLGRSRGSSQSPMRLRGTQSDIVNNKQHLVFVKYSPKKVICERHIRSFFSDLDDHNAYKLSGQRTNKTQETWATLEDLKKLWESNDDRSDAGMPRPEPASSGKSLTG